MSQLDKILIKIKNNPKSVTFDDMSYFLSALGYNKDNKGKTSGSRVIFIKDGQIFNEISRGDNTRKQFFDRIIDIITLLGGDMSDAL